MLDIIRKMVRLGLKCAPRIFITFIISGEEISSMFIQSVLNLFVGFKPHILHSFNIHFDICPNRKYSLILIRHNFKHTSNQKANTGNM